VGRDIFPFLQALNTIELSDYDIALKLHTKKSPHLKQGALWARSLIDSLTGHREVEIVEQEFRSDRALGLMAPASQFMPFSDPSSIRDNRENIEKLIERYGLAVKDNGKFVAGSMFWFRPSAFQHLKDRPLDISDFGPELGAIDGTPAHAMERLLLQFIRHSGFHDSAYKSEHEFNPYL
jgi:lipopolysaccharide biosynthesis protein